MIGQYLRYVDTNPSVECYFFNTADGTPRTDLVFGTASLTLGYRRPGAAVTNITPLVTQTAVGAWASGGFVHLAGGVYRLDLPVAANATGLNRVDVMNVTLPAGIGFTPFVVGLTADDLSAASETSATIATAVSASLSTLLNALPVNVRNEMYSQRIGVQTQPVGGSTQTLTVTDMPGTSALGTVTRYFDSGGRLVGQTELV